MKTKAFTILEVMIVVVIIGLLAAMVIPAYFATREINIRQKAQRGETLSYKEEAFLNKHGGLHKASQTQTFSNNQKYSIVVIDGKAYYLVPVN